MRLVMQSYQLPENCKICTKIETKVRAIKKEEERIKRWRNEGNRTHSIEKSQEMILHLEHEIKKLENDRDERQRSLWWALHKSSSGSKIIPNHASDMQVLQKHGAVGACIVSEFLSVEGLAFQNELLIVALEKGDGDVLSWVPMDGTTTRPRWSIRW
jgi:predicted ATPase